MRNYLKLLSFLRHHKRLFGMAVFSMFIASFFEVFQLSLMVPLVDRIFNNKKIIIPNELPSFLSRIIENLNNLEPEFLLPRFLVGFIFLLFIKNAITYLYQYLMGDLSQRIMRHIRLELYTKIQNLSLDYFSKKRTGELVSRITHDVNLVENAVSYAVTDLCRQSFVIIMWAGTAFVIDPKAAVVVFFIMPLIAIPMSKIGKRLNKISKDTQEKMADINTHLLETISGIHLVKAFCNESYEVNRFKGQNHSYYKYKMKSIKRTILISPLTEIMGGICGVTLILWFAQRLMSGQLSTGVFILFFGSIMSLISPIKKLGNVNAITQQALAANQRIYDVLESEPSVEEKSDAVDLEEMARAIRIEDVSFRYNEDSEYVLKDICLEVNKGELVAIVGPTGTGKTTLINLIPRFYDPTQGTVSMDGTDLREVTFASLRGQMGIVTQDTVLFNDTVKANISYGHQSATRDEVVAAAKKAYAHRFIEKMPAQYETIVGDRGFRLSGGEKQRIAIARAILMNPPILLLDEATSQLDSESETYVQEALDELMEGRTVVAIAHRLSTIMKADKIIVIDEGRIVGQGQHKELLQTCGLYQRLHKMQFRE